MPNLDPWINQNNSNKTEEYVATKTINKFENHLLSIKDEHQKRIRPNLYPTYNERHEKIIEMIDWTLEKYKEAVATNIKKKNHQNEDEQEEGIIDNIVEELDKKRDIAINKKKKALLKDEVSIYRLEENTLDYILFKIRELTGKLYQNTK
ncbi:MAG: hypothetical protein ACXWFC_09285 [Nitrososphaeraceae archaeon]